MPADVTREEFHALEQEVEGEKLVTRHILEQTGERRRSGRSQNAVRAGEEKLDGVDSKVGAKWWQSAIGRSTQGDGLVRASPASSATP